MYIINPLCENNKTINSNEIKKYFPHLDLKYGIDFYIEQRGEDYYVETTISDNEVLKKKLLQGTEKLQMAKEKTESIKPTFIQQSFFDDEKTIEEKVIDAVLKQGSHIEKGKYRIVYAYNNSPYSKFSNFLSDEYGIGGSMNGRLNISYSPKGLRIDYRDQETSSNDFDKLYKWTEISKKISTLIDKGEYLTAEEELFYEKYSSEQEIKNSRNLEILKSRNLDFESEEKEETAEERTSAEGIKENQKQKGERKMNNLVIQGNLVGKEEIKTSSKGNPYTSISLEVETFFNEQEYRKTFTVMCFGDVATKTKDLKIGDCYEIKGFLKNNSFNNKTQTNVVANSIKPMQKLFYKNSVNLTAFVLENKFVEHEGKKSFATATLSSKVNDKFEYYNINTFDKLIDETLMLNKGDLIKVEGTLYSGKDGFLGVNARSLELVRSKESMAKEIMQNDKTTQKQKTNVNEN